MACNVTSLMLYAIDALAEDEVVSFANHVVRCSRCQKRLTDPNELRAAILESTQPSPVAKTSHDCGLAELHAQRDRIDEQIQALEARHSCARSQPQCPPFPVNAHAGARGKHLN